MGYREYARAGKAARTPRMFGFQASGAAPIVRGEPVLAPVTIATAIRIGNPASWHLAEEARDASGGLIASVTDRRILSAYRLLAAKEAVFGELASAAGHSGLDLVVQSQGQPERVKTWPQVGARRGSPHHGGRPCPVHQATDPIRPAQVRPPRCPRPPGSSPARARRTPPSPGPSARCQ